MINKFTQSPLGLPKLRFKGFDGKWEEKTIKDVLDYEIYGNNISYDTKLFLDAPAIMKKNYSKFDNQNSFFAPSDTIIFIKDGSNAGNFFYSINNSRIASTCAYIKTLCYNLFIYYLLENNKQYIQNNLIVGETIPHLYKNTLINILIHFPSLQEQTKIATFFSLLDKQIELWEKKLQLVELIKKYYINSLSFDNTKMKKIIDVFHYINGKSIEKYFDNEKKSSNDFYNVISIGNYSEDFSYIDDGCRVNKNMSYILQNQICNNSDLCLVLNDKTSQCRILAKCILIEENNKYVINQRSIILRSQNNNFYFYYFQCLLFRNKIKKISQSGNQSYINSSQLLKIKIPCVNLYEQEQYIRKNKIANIYNDQIKQIINLLKNKKLYYIENILT